MQKKIDQEESEITVIRPKQLWAARYIIGWTRAQCAKATGLASETIRNIERDNKNKRGPEKTTLNKIVKGFAEHGVYFIERQNVFGVWRTLVPKSSNRKGDKP